MNKPAGVFSSSTHADLVAIELTMDWLWMYKENWGCAKVATDSQATLATLKKTRKGKCEELVVKIGGRISWLSEEGKQPVLVWVAGHCGLKGNELADKAAFEASHINQRSLAVRRSSLPIFFNAFFIFASVIVIFITLFILICFRDFS